MKSNMFRIAVVLAAALATSAGHAKEAGEDPKISFEKYTLDNGLEVILVPDRTAPVVFVSVWYHVGSGNETLGKSGFAHLFEHMMFQGSKHTGEDVHFPTLRKIGVTNVNGTTNTDRTNYFEEIPSNQLETALWLESDRMGYLLPNVTPKSFANQQEVVRNERRQNYDDVPYGKTRFAVAAALYPEGHPYRYLTIGRHEDLEKANLEDVKAFFEKWYVPSNATLTIAGDFDVDETKKLVDKWFKTFPKSTKPAAPVVAVPWLTKTKRVTVDDSFASFRRVQYAWHSPAFYAEGDAELDIIANSLAGGATGRLYKILVIEKQLARQVFASQASAGLSSTFQLVCDLRPDADLAEVEKIIDEELEKIRKDGPTQAEFDRFVVAVEAGNIWELESLAARAEKLQGYNHYTGDADYIGKDLARYRTSSITKARDAAQKYLAKSARAEVITMPVKKEGK